MTKTRTVPDQRQGDLGVFERRYSLQRFFGQVDRIVEDELAAKFGGSNWTPQNMEIAFCIFIQTGDIREKGGTVGGSGVRRKLALGGIEM